MLFQENKTGEIALDLAKRKQTEVEAAGHKQDASKLQDLNEIVRILTEKHNASERKRDSLVQVLITKEEQLKSAQQRT